jgi:Na+-driven multidrug efflux pump
MMRVFSHELAVISKGEEYLQIMCWSFVASGVIFVSSSMFQAMGNTIPSLVTSFVRLLLVAVPVLLLAPVPGFELVWIWYISAGTVFLQLAMSLLLLRREFRVRLDFGRAAAA